MEGDLSPGGMIPGVASFGGPDLQGPIRVYDHIPHPNALHYHQHPLQPQRSSAHPSVMGSMHSSDQTISEADYKKGDKVKKLGSDEDKPSEECTDDHSDIARGEKGSPWQRVKWTAKMVRLLITAVSYIGEDVSSDCGGGGMRRKFRVLKKGKWRLVSKVMEERGFTISPHQCEDKFNVLNKRYKRLNDMLGRGTSCQVVENPCLLDVIDYLTEKEKDDVRKILSLKHLFYEEMCSYHNRNKLHLPHDPALQHSLQLALRSRDDHDDDDGWRQHDDLDEDDPDTETVDDDEFEETHVSHRDNRGIYSMQEGCLKRLRQGQGDEDVCYWNPYNKGSRPQIAQIDVHYSQEGIKAAWLQKAHIESHTLYLEERKMQMQVEMLELKRQRFKWEIFDQKRDSELEKLRMENERMRLENELIALELKQTKGVH